MGGPEAHHTTTGMCYGTSPDMLRDWDVPGGHIHHHSGGVQMHQKAIWDTESLEVLHGGGGRGGAAAPSTSRGRGSHTQGGEFVACTEAMVVGRCPTIHQAGRITLGRTTAQVVWAGAHRILSWVRQAGEGQAGELAR